MTRLIGSILMIVGVSIGGGMLALPVSTAMGGFGKSSLLLVVIWSIMTSAAFLILEVNLSLPPQSNLVSMAKQTLGPIGAIICWLGYLLLLYCLLCAYTAGGSDIFHSLLAAAHLSTKRYLDSILFIAIFATIVYCGIRSVDYVNRLLIVLKVVTFIAMLLFIMPAIKLSNLATGTFPQLLPAVMVVATSFGYAIIVPSLRVYLKNDIRQLRLAILIGSTIPLICYIAWDYMVQGSIPKQELVAIAHGSDVVSQLTQRLSYYSRHQWLAPVIHIFTSVCLLTSFLGVSLSLTDFLSDGLQMKKVGWRNLFIHALTFLPALAIILFYPQAFIAGIKYAGINCVIILMLLPVLMAWSNRYHSNRATPYRVWGGKPLLLVMFVLSIILLVIAIVER